MAEADSRFPTDALETGKKKTRLPGEAGIWFFVVGDLLVFTLFFILIATGQTDQPAVFSRSRATLDLRVGVANTLLLLTGSWFVAIGVERCRSEQGRGASRYFSIAILSGLSFIANKSFEWGSKITAGITPATNDFYMYFFVFTGIHLFHVLIGTGVLVFVRHVGRRPALSVGDIRSIESGAIFWHLVDLLWIVLFALLYLI